MSPTYAPLHVHSSYSILDGIIELEALAHQAKKLGLPAVALTDHGNLHGTLKFTKACRAIGVKPILGMEAYTTRDPNGLPKEERNRDNFHLTLLAYNQAGYRNLLHLSAVAAVENFYYKPRIHIQNLWERNEGLIILSGCLGGELSHRLSISEEAARSLVEEFSEHLGERYFLEVQDLPDSPEQAALNRFIRRASSETSIQSVITTDAHFLSADSYSLHEIILCIQLKKTLEQHRTDKEMVFSRLNFLRPPADLQKAAEVLGFPQALHNTVQIAELVEEYPIGEGEHHPPPFDITTQPDYHEFLKWRDERRAE